ncbi:MAG: hypothetical protein K2X98_00685, partial [Alphaproteobacteria bacterium]|nr:hypothetical protein [Alphaproteobacteria bacterium]
MSFLIVFLIIFFNFSAATATHTNYPLYLTADKVTYDETLDVVEAFGHVEISQFLPPHNKKTSQRE